MINRIGLAVFVSVFAIIQVVFLIGLAIGWKKIKKLRQEEKVFLAEMRKLTIDQSSDDDDEW